MSELVRQHRHQINVVSVIVVQAQVEKRSSQTTRLTEIDIEVCVDFRLRRIRISTQNLAGQRLIIPSAGKGSPGKVSKDADCASGTEHGAASSASQRGPLRPDRDRDTTTERGTPLIGGGLKSDEPLLAQGCAAIAADRRDSCCIIESDA